MIYYLTHVNYNPAAADLTSIGVTIYLGLGGGGRRRAGTAGEAGRYSEGRRAGTGHPNVFFKIYLYTK